jgi:hypothetical protein
LSGETEPAIIRWGPKAGSFVKGFNIQSDGRSAFWILFDENQLPEEAFVLLLDGLELETFNAGAVLSGRLLRASDRARFEPGGKYPLEIRDRASGRTWPVGLFEVL